MAFLMLLHEKMRLQRKVNKLTLQQLKLSSRKERITKNISKVQKMYSSKMTQLEKSSQMMISRFKNDMLNSCGLGAQTIGFSPYSSNNSLFGGMTNFVLKNMQGYLQQGIPCGKDGAPVTLSEAEYNNLMNIYMTNGKIPEAYTEENGKQVLKKGFYGGKDGTIPEETVNAFMMAMRKAQSDQTYAQQCCNMTSSNFEQNVSIWLEAQKEQLEEEQDAALLPLEAEETDIELDNESCEAQLADAKARLESVKQACSEGIKDSAPTFGLG